MLYKQVSLVSYNEKGEALTSLELVLTVLSSALNRAGEFQILSCLSPPFSLPLSSFLCVSTRIVYHELSTSLSMKRVAMSKTDKVSASLDITF